MTGFRWMKCHAMPTDSNATTSSHGTYYTRANSKIHCKAHGEGLFHDRVLELSESQIHTSQMIVEMH